MTAIAAKDGYNAEVRTVRLGAHGTVMVDFDLARGEC